jgi:hypothetical protein
MKLRYDEPKLQCDRTNSFCFGPVHVYATCWVMLCEFHAAILDEREITQGSDCQSCQEAQDTSNKDIANS